MEWSVFYLSSTNHIKDRSVFFIAIRDILSITIASPFCGGLEAEYLDYRRENKQTVFRLILLMLLEKDISRYLRIILC
jgi:hypothetical protein